MDSESKMKNHRHCWKPFRRIGTDTDCYITPYCRHVSQISFTTDTTVRLEMERCHFCGKERQRVK